MRILGIDPGLASCGWAVLDNHNNGLDVEVAALGCYCTKPGELLAVRMARSARVVSTLIADWGADSVVVETPSFPRSARSALMLGAAYGVILGCMQAHQGAVLVARTTREWRALVGLGTVQGQRARKASTRMAMLARWPLVAHSLAGRPKAHHEHMLDALAIATSELESSRQIARAS